MRLLLLIFFFYFSSFCLGQDSLQTDTSFVTAPPTVQDNNVADSGVSKLPAATKKKPRKKKIKPKAKEAATSNSNQYAENVNDSGTGIGFLFPTILIIALLLILKHFRYSSFSSNKRTGSGTNDEELIADNLSRSSMSRQDYYRNVYLKSDAWKRKRFVVLKRDNWRCVYCGEKATEVHHTRYAKRNIGKEPIEWLVSICKTCHDSKHQ
jgi:HNH endonuclease